MAFNNTTAPMEKSITTTMVLISIFITTVMIATIVGNSLVIYCVCHYHRLRGRTNYLIVSLAVADWLVGVLSNPFQLLQVVNYSQWPAALGDSGCHFWICIDMLCSAASILSLTAISIDRLIAIVDPLKYEDRMRTTHIYLMISITWVFALICACLSLVEWKDEPVILVQGECFIKSKEYITFVASAAFFVPLVVVLINYSLIFRVAIRHAKHLHMERVSLSTNYQKDDSVDANHNEDDDNPSSSSHGNKTSFLKRTFFNSHRPKYNNKSPHATSSVIKQLKATKTLAVVIGVFCVCWLPFFIIFLTFQYCPECFANASKDTLTLFAKILPVANSAANPIIYTCFNAEFRRAFKRILWKILRKNKSDNAFTTSACATTIHDDAVHEDRNEMEKV